MKCNIDNKILLDDYETDVVNNIDLTDGNDIIEEEI